MHNSLLALAILVPFYGFSQTPSKTRITLNFSDTIGVYIDSNNINNIWQVGTPQKTLFDSAYSASNAIITDTINPYPISNTSEFTFKTPTYIPNYGGIDISFWHKYDTDTLKDGGMVLVSIDNVNWTNLLNGPQIFFSDFLYSQTDSVASLNDVGFSGNSGGWVQSQFFYNGVYPENGIQVDTLYLKFMFSSDNIDSNKEGWMIDDIHFWYNLGIGIEEQSNLNSMFVYPNPSNDIIYFSDRESSTYSILDSYGRKLLTGFDSSVDINALPNGFYHILFESANGVKQSAFMKQ